MCHPIDLTHAKKKLAKNKFLKIENLKKPQIET